jgi:hypothetical protein
VEHGHESSRCEIDMTIKGPMRDSLGAARITSENTARPSRTP